MPRLDQLLVHRGFFDSREKARRAVMAGWVRVEGALADKPGTPVKDAAAVEVQDRREPFVSRGGGKLEAALEHFGVDVAGRVCMDVGASTGGFTDCLLKRGASRVYAIDVGYGQLDLALRNDPRVVVMERTNAMQARSARRYYWLKRYKRGPSHSPQLASTSSSAEMTCSGANAQNAAPGENAAAMTAAMGGESNAPISPAERRIAWSLPG